MCKTFIIVLLAAGLVFPQFAHAGAIDGSSPCLCAITKAVECDSQGECVEIRSEDVNIPTFIKVDFKNKVLKGVDTDSRTTAIKNFEQGDGHMILQGAENQRVWSMMVTSETGKMSGSVSGEGYGFLLFGACTVLP
jgi:hypothetical protein